MPLATSLGYTIGFDGSGKIFHAYKGFGLPTQVFIDENGVIASIVGSPLDEAGAAAQIEAILPAAGGASNGARARPSDARAVDRAERARAGSDRRSITERRSLTHRPGLRYEASTW